MGEEPGRKPWEARVCGQRGLDIVSVGGRSGLLSCSRCRTHQQSEGARGVINAVWVVQGEGGPAECLVASACIQGVLCILADGSDLTELLWRVPVPR